MRVIYEAFFVMNELNSKLEKDIQYKHITTEFKPTTTHEHLYGLEATFIVTGYGNDGINEGYSVKLLSCENDELRELYNNISIPHITLSISNEGKPINTSKLNFISSSPDIIKTKFGGYIGKPIL